MNQHTGKGTATAKGQKAHPMDSPGFTGTTSNPTPLLMGVTSLCSEEQHPLSPVKAPAFVSSFTEYLFKN